MFTKLYRLSWHLTCLTWDFHRPHTNIKNQWTYHLTHIQAQVRFSKLCPILSIYYCHVTWVTTDQYFFPLWFSLQYQLSVNNLCICMLTLDITLAFLNPFMPKFHVDRGLSLSKVAITNPSVPVCIHNLVIEGYLWNYFRDSFSLSSQTFSGRWKCSARKDITKIVKTFLEYTGMNGLTLPMLWLLSSKPCHVGIHWIALG